MLKALDWLKDIIYLLGSIIQLILRLITDLLSLIINIPEFVSLTLRGVNAVLPTSLIGFVTISITISILFLILGRGRSN